MLSDAKERLNDVQSAKPIFTLFDDAENIAFCLYRARGLGVSLQTILTRLAPNLAGGGSSPPLSEPQPLLTNFESFDFVALSLLSEYGFPQSSAESPFSFV